MRRRSESCQVRRSGRRQPSEQTDEAGVKAEGARLEVMMAAAAVVMAVVVAAMVAMVEETGADMVEVEGLLEGDKR